MKNFTEYTLPYKLTLKDQAARIGITLLLMTLGIWSIFLLRLLGLVVCGILCYVAYRFYLSFHYEYEFSLVEDELRVAKIINLEKRKELGTYFIGKTESYGPIENLPQSQRGHIRSYLTHQGEEPEYYWVTHVESGERVCVLFQPSETLLEVFATRARGKLR
ncbi:MAG: hypothetical protein IJC46_00650 [Clostridia bacterium]|nr:hypothetical protein [Clostridia bacterium]